jgi:RimJ/RimL family protein N-acetyltransferase
MDIRKANFDDAEKWYTLVYEVKSEDLPTLFKMTKPITLDSTKEYLKNILENDGSFVLLCINEDSIIGSIDVVRKKRLEECHVADIGMCIKKEYRNKGIGTKLLQEMIEICREEKKIKKIELDVFSNNVAGKKLYEKVGFEYEGRRKRSIIKDNKKIDLIMMGKEILI